MKTNRLVRFFLKKPHEDDLFFTNLRDLFRAIHIFRNSHQWKRREYIRVCELCGEEQWRMKSRITGEITWKTKPQKELP